MLLICCHFNFTGLLFTTCCLFTYLLLTKATRECSELRASFTTSLLKILDLGSNVFKSVLFIHDDTLLVVLIRPQVL